MKRILLIIGLILILTVPASAQWMTNDGGSGAGATLNWTITKHASSAFTGATDDSHGDMDSGTPTPTYTIFTVTGDVIILGIWGVVNTSLTGAAATIEVGFAGNTAELIAQETAIDLDDGAVYVSTTVEDGGGPLAQTYITVNDGTDIIETTAAANIEAGQIDYYIIWAPVETGATIAGSGVLSN